MNCPRRHRLRTLVIVGRRGGRLPDGFCRDRRGRLESGYAFFPPHAADRLGDWAADALGRTLAVAVGNYSPPRRRRVNRRGMDG
jgi:hypothetical protein